MQALPRTSKPSSDVDMDFRSRKSAIGVDLKAAVPPRAPCSPSSRGSSSSEPMLFSGRVESSNRYCNPKVHSSSTSERMPRTSLLRCVGFLKRWASSWWKLRTRKSPLSTPGVRAGGHGRLHSARKGSFHSSLCSLVL